MADSAVLTQAIDPVSDRAVYKQIADHLRAAMGRGSLREGEQLPSEAQLMEHYGVARMTIRNALRVLQDEGLVTAEHGRGVYVRARPPVRRLASDRFAQRHRKEGMAAFTVEAAQIGAAPKVDMLTVTQAQPPPEIADRLGLADDSDVVVRSRRDTSPRLLYTSSIFSRRVEKYKPRRSGKERRTTRNCLMALQGPIPVEFGAVFPDVLSGAPDCRATWRLSTPEELLQHASVGVVLVIVADQKPSHRGPATFATPVAAAVHS